MVDDLCVFCGGKWGIRSGIFVLVMGWDDWDESMNGRDDGWARAAGWKGCARKLVFGLIEGVQIAKFV